MKLISDMSEITNINDIFVVISEHAQKPALFIINFGIINFGIINFGIINFGIINFGGF